MKISKSKQELARIISENCGWRDGAESAWFQGINNGNECHEVWFGAYGAAPEFSPGIGFTSYHSKVIATFSSQKFPNWHQTILSRAEYFHLYPAPDADGWIEWKGGECPVEDDAVIDIRFRDGHEERGVDADWDWEHSGGGDIIAYRLHKPEQAKPEFCESVMRSIPEPEAKPTIEQLAADYRKAKDYAERKQQEADDAKADADSRLKELELAGEAIGLVLSVAEVEPEPELVITDWRDLQVGDEVEYLDGGVKHKIGMIGTVDKFDHNSCTNRFFRIRGGYEFGWPTKWRFMRRP